MNALSALEIEVFDGNKSIARGVFDQTKVIIGRISSADFRVSDPRVSRIHALLERLDDGSLRLTDLASTHGTFVNGERIVERILSPKDEVAVAELKVKLNYVTVEPTAPGTAAPSAALREQVPGHAALQSRPPPPPAAPAAPAPRVASEASRAGVQSASGAEMVVEPHRDGPRVAREASVAAPAPGVRVTGEATVIRSLKETARTRGVLDPAGMAEDLEVTVYWEDSILAIDHYRKSSSKITIGEHIGNTYIVPSKDLPPKFPFIRVHGTSVELNLHPSMKGSARVQGKMETFDDLRKKGRATLTLSGQDIAKVQVGTVNFFLMFVPEPPPIPKASVFDQGGLFWTMQISAAVAAILFITLATVFRTPIEGVVKEFPEKYRKIIVEEFKKKEEIKKVEAQKVPGLKPSEGLAPPGAVLKDKVGKTGGNEGEGMREKGAEGKRGRPDSPHETGITNRPKTSASTKVKDAPVRAKNEGILDTLRNTGLGTKLAKVSGVTGGASGNDPLDKALSGVGGGGVRNGRGSGGSGLQGSGTGGGGTAEGVGGLGSKGYGGGASGNGVGSIPGKGDFAVGVEGSGVTVIGSLSREEIERVVNAHQSEIYFCYQRELQKTPGLFGKITLKWTIVTGGSVSSIVTVDNGTGSASLESCIRERLRQWVFPSPVGGSQAEAKWPWVFKPQGT
ncbi:MAG: FHA domain-containing protein [Bdellovibrionales bacterium]|nr:FHA domain-containing protein [Bdellovibrionales bacterium]